MKNVFLIADTHFGHLGICRFAGQDGVTKLRPWDHPDAMDEDMVERWNKIVGDSDRVYMLGDVAIRRQSLKILERLRGRKVLIKGNHDIFTLRDYLPFFDDIRGCHVLDGVILSHVPIHPDCVARFGANIHGHLHDGRVMQGDRIDPRYFCVSAEHINFQPISLEEVRQRIAKQNDIH